MPTGIIPSGNINQIIITPVNNMKLFVEIVLLLAVWLAAGWIFARAWMRGSNGEDK